MTYSEEAHTHAMRLLERYEGDVAVVSEMLGIPKRTIYYWWQKAHPEHNPIIAEPTEDEDFAEDLGNIIRDLRKYLHQTVKGLPTSDHQQTSVQLLAISRVIDRLPVLVEMHENYLERLAELEPEDYKPATFDTSLHTHKVKKIEVKYVQDASEANWMDFRRLFCSLEQAALIWYKRFGFYPVDYKGSTYPDGYEPPESWDADLTPEQQRERDSYQRWRTRNGIED